MTPSMPLSCCIDIINTPKNIGFLVPLPKILIDVTTFARILPKSPTFVTSVGLGAVSSVVAGLRSRSFSRSALDTPSLSQALLASSFRPLYASHRGDSDK